MMPFKGTSRRQFQSHSFNRFKAVEVEPYEVDALPAPFMLTSGLGFIGIVGVPWLHHMAPLTDVTMGTKAYVLLLQGKTTQRL
jgi:hypothetical protein